jgi:hypothetical protein
MRSDPPFHFAENAWSARGLSHRCSLPLMEPCGMIAREIQIKAAGNAVTRQGGFS